MCFPPAARFKRREALMARMTQQDAHAEAIRRWGKERGIVRLSSEVYHVGLLTQVQVNRNAKRNIYYGYGESWEEAFADADRKEKEQAHGQ